MQKLDCKGIQIVVLLKRNWLKSKTTLRRFGKSCERFLFYRPWLVLAIERKGMSSCVDNRSSRGKGQVKLAVFKAKRRKNRKGGSKSKGQCTFPCSEEGRSDELRRGIGRKQSNRKQATNGTVFNETTKQGRLKCANKK